MDSQEQSKHVGFSVRSTRVFAVLIASLMIGIALVPMGSSAAPKVQKEPLFVIGAAGDICGTHLAWNNPQRHQYDNVADLLVAMGVEKFLMLGDAQHEDGFLADYLTYYDAEFGKLLDITCPVPGNHDYYWDGWAPNNPHSISNGSGYFGYFGEIAHPPLGYYSFDLGPWHLIALNSPLVFDYDYTVPGNPGNEQWEWLKQDLADHPNSKYPGTIVYFHHPLYDWETPNSPQWSSPELVPIWDLLYANHVDIVLNGHAHNYQRWAPQDAYGNFKADGIRQFTVGTGGYYMNNLGHPPKPANFIWGQNSDFGALKLKLFADSCSFEFVSITGSALDSGSFACN